MMDGCLEIARVADRDVTAALVPEVLDTNNVQPVELGCHNWSADYPDRPHVSFRIAHNGDSILIAWRSDEAWVRAVADDNGRVWEDSCVEFFISFDGNTYYNIECNCRGAMLCGHGSGKTGRVAAPGELLEKVSRTASLGTGAFATRKAGGVWELSMVIPLSLFFNGAPATLDGVEASGNFYKCGDMLPGPHFMSWHPVATPTPDFHRIEYFGKLKFQQA